MTNKKLTGIRNELIAIMRNSDIVYNYDIRGVYSDRADLLSIIASLYNLLHYEVTGEAYEYFFHWANKCGGWVEDNYFTENGDLKREVGE